METRTGNGHKVDVEKFMEDLKAVVRDGQDLLKAGMGTVREKAISASHTTDRRVRDNPYQSIGIVFGAGILVGLLASGLFGGSSDAEAEKERY
jgi:ElaB/YqjD/DUF883 family membrane-anchored ribosome-binding protein